MVRLKSEQRQRERAAMSPKEFARERRSTDCEDQKKICSRESTQRHKHLIRVEAPCE